MPCNDVVLLTRILEERFVSSHRTLPVDVGELGSERGGEFVTRRHTKQQLQSDFDKDERSPDERRQARNVLRQVVTLPVFHRSLVRLNPRDLASAFIG